MNTNMTGFSWFSKISASLVLWMKVALTLGGLNNALLEKYLIEVFITTRHILLFHIYSKW